MLRTPIVTIFKDFFFEEYITKNIQTNLQI